MPHQENPARIAAEFRRVRACPRNRLRRVIHECRKANLGIKPIIGNDDHRSLGGEVRADEAIHRLRSPLSQLPP